MGNEIMYPDELDICKQPKTFVKLRGILHIFFMSFAHAKI